MLPDKKIAFVIDGLQMGGAEKFLINNVNNFHHRGYQPIVLLLSKETTLINELEKEIQVIILTRSSRYDLTITRRIKQVLKAEGINKVFCINPYAFFLTKLAFVFEKKTKFYLSLHSTVPLSRKKYMQHLIYLRLVSKHDTVIYVCNNQKNYLKKKYYLHSDHELVIYNGIDISYFDPALFENVNFTTLREAYDLGETDKVIINVARLYPLKGHFDAIDALDILHTKYNIKAHLLIVGGGDPGYTQSLNDHSKKKELEHYVHFAGNQPDVRKFYCISDMFTLTSHTETFSLAVLEAMAFGLSCSLTDVGGANEMIVDGLTGTLSKPRDPLSIAESWRPLLNGSRNKTGIRQFVIDRFDSKKMFHEYFELVEKAEN